MPDEIMLTQWPSDVILKKLERLETVILGVPGTDSRGMAGDMKVLTATVGNHNKDIARIKIAVYALVVLVPGGTLVTKLLGL